MQQERLLQGAAKTLYIYKEFCRKVQQWVRPESFLFGSFRFCFLLLGSTDEGPGPSCAQGCKTGGKQKKTVSGFLFMVKCGCLLRLIKKNSESVKDTSLSTYISILSCNVSVFISADDANEVIKRHRRASSLLLEEVLQGSLERECLEERCTQEEAREVFENDEMLVSILINFLLLTWSNALCCHLYLQQQHLGKKQQGKGKEEPWPPAGDKQDRMGSPPKWMHNREMIVGQFFKEALLLQGSAISFMPMKCFFSFITS